jgi:phosphatidylcholine synthase
MVGFRRVKRPPNAWQRARAHAVHLYTASGVVFAFLATAETTRAAPDARWVFAWLAVAVLVDATDGPLARAWEVKRWALGIDGRTIDDIVDYLTFTFIPLLLVWRMGWLPEPAAVWVAPALIASLLGFANTGAKDEVGGFFLGFPSYWNIVAFYAGLIAVRWGTWPNAVLLVLLAVLSVVPVRFIYPNLAPRPWKVPVLAGAAVWLGTMVAMLPSYPRAPGWLFAVSLVYPTFYVGLSWHLARRRERPNSSSGGV